MEIGRRIVVIGDSGSGKSSLALELSRRLLVRVLELDDLYWGPGWTPVDIEAFRERVTAITSADEWILVGNYRLQQSDISWPRATSIIWLDLPLYRTIPRLVMRARANWRQLWLDRVTPPPPGNRAR